MSRDRAEQWLREHPGLGSLPPEGRLPSGESGHREKSNYLGSGKGKVLAFGFEDEDFEQWERTHHPLPIARESVPGETILAEHVARVMQKLKPKYRELLYEFYWERKTLREMAAWRKVSPQAVSQQLATARKKFAKAMARLGTAR